MNTTFMIPQNPRIGRGDDTERLYQLEEARNKAIEKAANELGKVLGHRADHATTFWHQTMPEELRSILESFEQGAAEVAAMSFLISRGFKVTEPENHPRKFLAQ